ncbi:hypothetical protein QZH41_016162 [Actinostola sp. cb2023]|nr:hypothetical protein QZH41_016162 [Actinostola sp. cb2023]
MHLCPKQTNAPYYCGHCSLSFTNASDLRGHVMTHNRSDEQLKVYQPSAKRHKADDTTSSNVKFSYEDLHNYLFHKRNATANTPNVGIPVDGSTSINPTSPTSHPQSHEVPNPSDELPDIVRVCSSVVPGAGYGVQASQVIPEGAWIGPYKGRLIKPGDDWSTIDSSYLWEIFNDGKLLGYIDGGDKKNSSWMRFIRCARHKQEQNLYAFQYLNKIYYRAYKTIQPGQELLVWYDDIYTQYLGIPYEGIYDMASSKGNFQGSLLDETRKRYVLQSMAKSYLMEKLIKNKRKVSFTDLHHYLYAKTSVRPIRIEELKQKVIEYRKSIGQSPYEGRQFQPNAAFIAKENFYMWEVFHGNQLAYFLDGSNEDTSSWMRFIACARNSSEQNLYAFQYCGNIYYRAFKEISPGTELLVWYDEIYPQSMGIPLTLSDLGNMETEEINASIPSDQNISPSTEYIDRNDGCLNKDDVLFTRSATTDHSPVTTISRDNRTTVLTPRQSRDRFSSPTSSLELSIAKLTENILKPSQDDSHEFESNEVTNGGGDDDGESDMRREDDTGMALFRCGQCDKAFPQKSTLQLHICTRAPNKPYECGFCGNAFANPNDLRAHSASHCNEKPFKCGYCSRSFSGATTLNNHIRAHTGEKPFNCEKCGKTFSQGAQLSRHQRISTECKQVNAFRERIENCNLEIHVHEYLQASRFQSCFTSLVCHVCRVDRPPNGCPFHEPSSSQAADQEDCSLSYAIKSFPQEVQLCTSSIPGAHFGVCAKRVIPEGTWIGPYEGKRVKPEELPSNLDNSYIWEIYENGQASCYIDGSDEGSSSWMRFIRCARHKEEQNLYAFQYLGNVFYRSFKDISKGTEMLVWYDDKYPQYMGIPTGLQEIEFINALDIESPRAEHDKKSLAEQFKQSTSTEQKYDKEIFQDGRLVCYLDASDENTSSWMRFIRCARHRDEQNLYAFQYCGNIYYRAFRNISVGEELLVWYDDKYQQHMGLPLNIQDMAVVDPNALAAMMLSSNRQQVTV